MSTKNKMLKHHRVIAARIAELECAPSKAGTIAIEELDSENNAVIQLNDVREEGNIAIGKVLINYSDIDALPITVKFEYEFSPVFYEEKYILELERSIRQAVQDYYHEYVQNRKALR